MTGSLSRRGFIAGIGASGLALGLPSSRAAGGPATVAHWVQVRPDNRVTLFISQTEMGQGIWTGFAQILADELEADWAGVDVADAPGGPAFQWQLFDYRGQFTGGSCSTTAFWTVLRQAGAAARLMLRQAAAAQWNVPVDQVKAVSSLLSAGERRATYGDVAAAASRLPVPQDPPLKAPAEWRYIGRAMPRVDTAAKVNGSARFGIDQRREGQLYAAVRHPDVIGATVTRIDDTNARSIDGVVQIINAGDAAIVVANTQFGAIKASRAIEVTGANGAAGFSTEAMRAALKSALVAPDPATARSDGPPTATAFSAAARVFEAEYEVPVLAHATMEPPACLADVRADGVTIQAPTQGQDLIRTIAAQITGLPPEKVEVRTTFAGGGFGRKFVPDFQIHAILASKATGRPVKMLWTREEDIRHDHYRPALMSRMRLGVDKAGQPMAFEARVVGQGVLGQVFPTWAPGEVDEATVEGTRDLPYAIPSIHVETKKVALPLPLGFMRSVGRGPNAFFVESMIDEVALATGQDAYQLRRRMLVGHDPRGVAVLDAVVALADWTRGAPPGRHRGLAYHAYAGRGDLYVSRVAEIAEISVSRDGELKVHRVFAAVDCGRVINPNAVEAQVEGGIGFGLAAALKGKITFKDGAAEQSNFDGYPVLMLDEMPEIVITILSSDEAPGGMGEPAVPPIAPAVTNAIARATGQRIRSLPISDHTLRPL